ncbi:MAG: HigA family addiction module antitoxin [Gammaproteobacteria bacterium]
MTTKQLIHPVHPGHILLEEFLIPLSISQYRLAKDIQVPARRINEIVKGKRAITVDTAIRLGLFFGMSSEFWIGLQTDYDLDTAKLSLQAKLQRIVHPWHGQIEMTTTHPAP